MSHATLKSRATTSTEILPDGGRIVYERYTGGACWYAIRAGYCSPRFDSEAAARRWLAERDAAEWPEQTAAIRLLEERT